MADSKPDDGLLTPLNTQEEGGLRAPELVRGLCAILHVPEETAGGSSQSSQDGPCPLDKDWRISI